MAVDPDAMRWTDAFRAEPATAGVFMDFDGTLAEIVDVPAEAAPVGAAPVLLRRLAERYGRVAILSGRPVAFLEQFFDPPIVLAGLYGLESIVDGSHRDHPQSGAWREVVDDVAAHARAVGPEGMLVEPKGLSLTLHFRGHEDLEPQVRALAESSAQRSGLVVRPAKMSYELHPPIEADKGTALVELAEGLARLVYIGDDVGDLPAFDALDRLAAGGVEVHRVCVDSVEVSRELRHRADLVVPGPTGVVTLLGALAEVAERQAS